MRLARAFLTLATAGAAMGLHADAGAVPAGPSGSVTYLVGEASRSAGGKTDTLTLGSLVYENDVVETRGRTRLEVKLPDKSVIRIGPQSRVQLVSAIFGRSVEERKVSAKIVVGNIWAKVTRAAGGESHFEVRTENAVAGVRGTTFRVDAKADRSVVVKVYSGAVAVAGAAPLPRPSHEGGKQERRQVPGPQQVSRQQWEKLVGQMMQIAVAPDGTPGEPKGFALAAPGQDEWEDWNRERDQAAE
jgi:hypothetical protein